MEGNMSLPAVEEETANKHSHGVERAAGASHKRKRPEEEQRTKMHKPMIKYERGSKADLKHNADKKLHRVHKQQEAKYRSAQEANAAAEMLLTEDAGFLEAETEMEKTYRMKQTDIAKAVDVGIAKNSLEIALDTYGPYKVAYERNGRHMLLSGSKGHLAVVDWHTMGVSAEFHVHEQVHDAVFLHNHSMFAVAQKKYAYIYDHTGAEVHVLRNHQAPLALEYLPYHYLLASVGNAGWLKYQDTSTGKLIAEHRTKLGSCSVLRQNPWNAVLACGHSNGVVTMWTPNMATPVVRLAAHKGPLTALAIDQGGRYMVTGGMDARLKVWDIRKFQEVHSYFTATPAHSLDISQRGLVAVGHGSHVQVWGREFALEMGKGHVLDKMPTLDRHGKIVKKGSAAKQAAAQYEEDSEDEDEEGEEQDEETANNPFARRALAVSEAGVTKAKSPYMRHELPGKSVVSVRFRPYEDLLAVGHTTGLSSLIIPGAGEPHYDSREADPYQSKKGKQEAEVHGLLDKLPPSMISLEPSAVGAVDGAAPSVKAKEQAEAAAAAIAAITGPREKKRKRRGIRKALKKQGNIITEQKMALQEKLKEEQTAREEADKARKREKAKKEGKPVQDEDETSADRPKSALSRFFK